LTRSRRAFTDDYNDDYDTIRATTRVNLTRFQRQAAHWVWLQRCKELHEKGEGKTDVKKCAGMVLVLYRQYDVRGRTVLISIYLLNRPALSLNTKPRN
jgi:hypothetical protein